MEVKVDDDDYKRLIASKSNYRSDPLRWQATFNPRDKKIKYYASKTIDYKKWKMHRYIFHLRGIETEGMEVDHINGDTLDNRFANLRLVNSRQNKQNSIPRTDAFSKYKGVGWRAQRKCWRAYITINGKMKHLGSYRTEEEAALAYNKAAIETWGPYAHTNKINRSVLLLRQAL